MSRWAEFLGENYLQTHGKFVPYTQWQTAFFTMRKHFPSVLNASKTIMWAAPYETFLNARINPYVVPRETYTEKPDEITRQEVFDILGENEIPYLRFTPITSVYLWQRKRMLDVLTHRLSKPQKSVNWLNTYVSGISGSITTNGDYHYENTLELEFPLGLMGVAPASGATFYYRLSAPTMSGFDMSIYWHPCIIQGVYNKITCTIIDNKAYASDASGDVLVPKESGIPEETTYIKGWQCDDAFLIVDYTGEWHDPI